MASADGDGLAQSVDLLAAEIVFDHKSRLIDRNTPGNFIESYCQKERYGGGDVLQTIHPWQGDESRALVVFDPKFCKPDVVQSLAKKLNPPVLEIVEFSEGQCFGKGSICVSPRLKEKLLKHFEADKIFNNLYSETGVTVSADSWCLTGYFFQLKLAEICLQRLEGEADRKVKAGGGQHLQDTTRQNLSAEVSEDAKKQLKPTPRSRASAPKPTEPVPFPAEASPNVETHKADPTNKEPAISKVSEIEKNATEGGRFVEKTTSNNTSPDNQLLSSSANLLASSHDNPDKPPPDAEVIGIVTSPRDEDSSTDSIQQPLILTHQLKKQKLGLPSSFVYGSEPKQQDPLTEDDRAEIEGNASLLKSSKSSSTPASLQTSQEDEAKSVPNSAISTAANRVPVTTLTASSAHTSTTAGGVTTFSAAVTTSVSTNEPTAAVLPYNHSQPKSSKRSKNREKEATRSDVFPGEHKTNKPKKQLHEKQKLKEKDQKTKTEKASGSTTDKAADPQVAQKAVDNLLRGESKPLPDSDTETPGEDEQAEKTVLDEEKANTVAPEKTKTNASEKLEKTEESMSATGQIKAKRLKLGTSYVYDTEEEFDRIYYEFVTTVLKEKFDRKVAKQFSGRITERASPADSHMILVNIRSLKRDQSEGMMEALNALYSETVFQLHSNVIKVLYDGDKGKLAKALIEELPQKYPDEKLVARLVTDKDIRIIGYLKNLQRDEHVVDRFVGDYKEKHPAPQRSYAKTSDIRLSNGAVVRVIEGDLTKMKCDAVVSSSGSDLAHKFGVSRAIALACGQKFVSDGRLYIGRHGELSTGQTFTQPATGRLNQLYGVNYVIHAIAPSPRQPGDINELIIKTVLNALTEADTLKCRSVALPAICSGRMGVPISTCAHCYWVAMEMFAAQVQRPILKEINFVVDDMEIVLKIDLAFKQHMADAEDQTMQSAHARPSHFSRDYSSSAAASRPAAGLYSEEEMYAHGSTKRNPDDSDSQGGSAMGNDGRRGGDSKYETPTSDNTHGVIRVHGMLNQNHNMRSVGQPGPGSHYTVLTQPTHLVGSSVDPTSSEHTYDTSLSDRNPPSFAAVVSNVAKNAVVGAAQLAFNSVVGGKMDDRRTNRYFPQSGQAASLSSFPVTSASAATTSTSAARTQATHASSTAATSASGASAASGTSGPSDTECPICMDELKNPQTLQCSHKFCKDCLDQVISTAKSHLCPTCRTPFRTAEGKQPRDGRMDVHHSSVPLPGYDRKGSIVITYTINSGIQGPEHPHPGQRYEGTRRTAYLPDNHEGRKVERLLRKAFDQRLIFTIGQSVTTGRDNCVVWNDIHHKTNIHGGPSGYGYPDPDYLARVTEDLKAKGITE